MIQGQVVDDETGKPIEGAAVAIKWYKYKFGPPYASGYKKIETAEDFSDADGFFELPKFTFKQHFMGVYKTGYVCWNTEKIFHPDRLFYKTRFEKRKDHKLKNGMVVKLAPFKDTYPRDKHARFTVDTSIRCSASTIGIFGESIKSERELYRKFLRSEQ